MAACVCFVCGKPTPGAKLLYFKNQRGNKKIKSVEGDVWN